MNQVNGFKKEVAEVKNLFLRISGLSQIETSVETVGPDAFLNFHVGRKGRLYSEYLGQVRDALPEGHPFYGSLLLEADLRGSLLDSPEAELLRVFIARALVVNRQTAGSLEHLEFAPSHRGEEAFVIEPSHHFIVGRRGVGKSALILHAVNRLKEQNHLPIWLELRRYQGRDDATVAAEVLADFVQELLRFDLTKDEQIALRAKEAKLSGYAQRFSAEVKTLRRLVPDLARALTNLTTERKQHVFLFLDDFHLLAPSLQPELLALIYSAIQGANTWLKVAFARHLGRHGELGVQAPNGAQVIDMDFDLTDPARTTKHLLAILHVFLKLAGIERWQEIIIAPAIDRLVWCSGGVARDFLALFGAALGYAREFGHKTIWVQDVNLAVSELGQSKLSEWKKEISAEDLQEVRTALGELQRVCLDDFCGNAFLVPYLPDEKGYQTLQKLLDLRLIHLLNSNIILEKGGRRHEAYLLDHLFYTGARRRKIQELQFDGSRPKLAELRRLPVMDVDTLSEAPTAIEFSQSFEFE